MNEFVTKYKRLVAFSILVAINSFSTLLLLPLIINGEFVYDEGLVISENPFVHSTRNLHMLLNEDYYRYSGESTYRPFLTYTYFIDYYLYGLSAPGFHLSNSILHFITGMLVGILGFMLFGLSGGVIASTLFAFHAGIFEAVANAGFREDILACLFILIGSCLSLSGLHRVASGKSGAFQIIGSLVSYSLALASKESALFFPLLILSMGTLSWNARSKKYLLASFTLHCLVSLYFVFLWFVILPSPTTYYRNAPELLTRIASVPGIIAFYVRMSFFPAGLSVVHLNPALGILGVVLILLFILFAVLARKSSSAAGFGCLWFCVALLPVLNLYPPLINLVAERYLYMPYVGMSLALGAIFQQVFAPFRRSVLYLVPAVVCISLFVLYPLCLREVRISDWLTEERLWEAVLEREPNNAQAHFNIGREMQKKGFKIEALREIRKANQLKPGVHMVTLNLGLLYDDFGDLEKAETFYRETLQLNPNSYRAHNNLGVILCKKQQYEDALTHFDTAAKLNPDSVTANVNALKTRLTLEGQRLDSENSARKDAEKADKSSSGADDK